MRKIGHIENIQNLPPQLIDLETCDNCGRNGASMIFEMNPLHSKDMQLCILCAEHIITINRMIEYMEN